MDIHRPRIAEKFIAEVFQEILAEKPAPGATLIGLRGQTLSASDHLWLSPTLYVGVIHRRAQDQVSLSAFSVKLLSAPENNGFAPNSRGNGFVT